MATTDLASRDYKMDDLIMLQKVKVFQNRFLTDQAAFTAEFPKFATLYETVFQAKIDDADAIS